ncbi:hypothetical protein [Prosthecobacter sp.]|uniref:hypothetical protein n=1 Tax=Prosthecobacter sp. TaxID=1965333 RepID=UPI003783E65F
MSGIFVQQLNLSEERMHPPDFTIALVQRKLITIKNRFRLSIWFVALMMFQCWTAHGIDLSKKSSEYRVVHVSFQNLHSGIELDVQYGKYVKIEETKLVYKIASSPSKSVVLTTHDVAKLHDLLRHILQAYSLEESTDVEGVMDCAGASTFIVEVGTAETSVVLRYNIADETRIKVARECFDWLLSKCQLPKANAGSLGKDEKIKPR